jgi:predicted Fe-Mo cluster-binding NifX family protein
MILIISAINPNLDSPVDYRFGRCPWLIRFDTDTNQWEAFENPGASQSGGSGVAAAQFVIDQKAKAVISGDFGPHAADAFRAANIAMHLFIEGVSTVKNAAEFMIKNELPAFQ